MFNRNIHLRACIRQETIALLELIIVTEEREYGQRDGGWVQIQRQYDSYCMLTSALVSTSDLARALKYAELCRDVRLKAEAMHVDRTLDKHVAPFHCFQVRL
jgi:hypothetical protein